MAFCRCGIRAQSLASWISTVMRPRPSHLHINRGASAAVNGGSVRCAPGESGSGIWSIAAGAYREAGTGTAVVARRYGCWLLELVAACFS